MSVPAQINHKGGPLYIELREETHPFYTSGDPVRGVIRVDPSLRPKSISITFKGLSLIYDQNAHGATPTFFTYSQDIFVSAGAHEHFDILQKGTARDGKVELPFEFTFPLNVWSAPPSDRDWHYPGDPYHHPRYQHSPGFVPPPSCAAQTGASTALAPKVTYMLEAHVDSCTKVQKEIKYLPPAPEYDLALLQPNLDFGSTLPKHCCHYKFIRTRKLLPGYKDSSRLGKVRDILVEKELLFGLDSFQEVPHVRFNVFATPARVLVIGSQTPITITVQHLDRSASIPDPPDLFLRRIRVQLLPVFHVFVPHLSKGTRGPKESVSAVRDTLTLLDKKFEDGKGKPLFDGLNLSDIADVGMVHDRLLPSFTSYGLALEYEVQVHIWGECAKHEFSGIVCKANVQVVSGWGAPRPQADLGEGGPSEAPPAINLQELGPEMGARVPSYHAYDAPPPLLDVAPRPMPPPYAA
ncbi:hypothetical protein GQ44DRAFT_708975 [Phaeosphaeriaceae sp. PMI808]|nr:hypothetical protein GQ44DRAFT_708975 [Phaeosphaeriaceae sp. PMI808]